MLYNKGANDIAMSKGRHLTGFLHTKRVSKKTEYFTSIRRIFGIIILPFTFLFSSPKKSRNKSATNPIVFNKPGQKKFALKPEQQDINVAIAEKMIGSMAPKNVNKKPVVVPTTVKRAAAVPVMALLIGAAFFAMFAFNSPEYTVFLQDGNNITAIKTKTHDVESFLIEQGITLGGEDKISVSLEQATSDNLTIIIKRAFPVTITTKDGQITVQLSEGTVKDALNKAQIYVWQDDTVEPAMTTELTSGMNITYKQISYKYEQKTESVAYKTVRVNNSTLAKGTTKVTQAGVAGTKTTKYKLIYSNGVLVDKQAIETVVTKSPVNEIIAVGTKVATVAKTTTTTNTTTNTNTGSGSITISAAARAAGVDASQVKSTMSIETTAYTHTGNRTATGTWPKVGTVAVNPKQIPYGTKLYIEGYGFATAEDTGGFVRSTTATRIIVDLFMNSEAECILYGRHYNVRVYVLK